MPDKTTAIEFDEIQAKSDSKPGSPKFISFSLLINNFSHFKCHTITVLMKVPILIDEKKKSQNLSKQKLMPVATASLDL